jgi:hypothetical protein
VGERVPAQAAGHEVSAQGLLRRHSFAIIVVICATALRVPGMIHDFWFDEVWSYLLVQEVVTTPLDIVTRLHIDNNHPLNSLFLYALGAQPSWWIYRVPSLAFGVASVAAVSTIMSRRGRAHAIAAAILVGCSFPLITYASEARGYMAMVFFALVAIDAYERYRADRRNGIAAVLWLAVVLGLLSHLTFFQAYAALLIWSLYDFFDRPNDMGPRDLVLLHGVPLIFVVIFYQVYVRHVTVAGAEPASLLSAVGETLSVAVGTPVDGAWPWIAAAVALGTVIDGLRIVKRADRGMILFFLTAMVLAPAFVVFVEVGTSVFEPRFFPRYFLIGITLFLLLLSWVFGEHYHRGQLRTVAATALVTVCVAGNLWQVVRFIREGRGHYREAVDYLSQHTAGTEIRVSSNSDFRTGRLLAFYQRYLPPDKHLTWLSAAAPDRRGADWRIVESVEPQHEMPAEIDDGRGGRFRLARRFGFYGLSGSQWTLYAREAIAGSVNGQHSP